VIRVSSGRSVLSPDRPPWLLATAYAAAATLAICWPVWPGFMTYDGVLAWEQTKTGVQTMTWPPMHTYLFALSRQAGAGTGGLLAAQTFLLFFAAALALGLVASRRWIAIAGMAAFAALFVAVPALLGVTFVHWRDVPTASFALLGLALWLAAARARSLPLLVAAVVSIGLAISLRYNAFALFALVVPLMVWSPYLGPSPARARIAVVVTLVAGLALAWGSTRWRLPDLAPVPKVDNFAGTQLLDLFGVSACSGRNYLPPAVAEGATVTQAQIRRAYDPRHLHLTIKAQPGLPHFFETDGDGEVKAAWRDAVARDFPCYLAHRNAVFVEQMGLSRYGVFMTTHPAIDPTSDRIVLARPGYATQAALYAMRSADGYGRRPILLYLAAPLLALLAMIRRPAAWPLLTVLLGGCAAYPALLYVAAPAADARYIFPSSVLCAFVMVASALILASPKRQEPAPDAG